MYVLGIDGGGTKTTGVIANGRGEVQAMYTVRSTNPNVVKKSILQKELSTLFTALQKQNRYAFSHLQRVFAAMSGVDHSDHKKEMKQIIHDLLPNSIPVDVDNDAVAALYSGTYGAFGVVQIAGTGSITYGINDEEKRGRVGGWGHLIDERGSGFSIGSLGLREAFSAYDRGIKTLLEEKLLNYFSISSLPELVQHIYRGPNPKETVASLSRLIIQAADEKDRVAQRIIRENGQYMGESIVRLIQKLFKQIDEDREIPIVFAGGLFHRFDLFRHSVEEVMQKYPFKTRFIIPVIEPVGGSVIAALRRENISIHDDFPDVFHLS
ncbi:MAG TPA: BadF/BadG/BcrA/BcrD ATPase family protein [Bacillota bacterium]